MIDQQQQIRIRNTAFSSAAVFFLLVVGAWEVLGSPGNLDPTFSGDGKLTDFIIGAEWNSFAATVIQPDGKIVAVGSTSNPLYIYVARYNPDGSPDMTFSGGKVAVRFGPFYSYVTDVALQPDGKIVLAGCYCEEDGGDYTLALARLNPDGMLDTSFGINGVVTRPDIVGPANSVAIQTDGKIVVAGQAGFYLNWLVARFNSNGSIDTTFNGTGIIVTDSLGAPYSVVMQSDGKIVAAGSTVYSGLTSDFAVVRYNANGTLDTTFDGDGIVTTSIGPWEVARSIEIQTDGKIVAAGESNAISNNVFAVVRYNPNGSLDTTFDGDGIVTTRVNNGAGAFSAAIQSDGKLVAAGESDSGFFSEFALVRYNLNGSLDTTFGGGDGRATVNFSADAGARGMAVDGAGRAVVVGRTDTAFAITRFLLRTTRTVADFDGDGRSDVSVFRPSDQVWYLDRSSQGFGAVQFGLSTDAITPADFDGDGKTDIAIFRDGTWWRMNSSNGTVSALQFGLPGDIPVPADYTGDGRDDLAVYRNGQWWAYDLFNNQTSVVNFGLATDKPVAADYDGDGRVDQAVYRNGEWHVNLSTQGYAVVNFGLAADRPVVGDYDGDGKSDAAVYRGGTWHVLGSSQGYSAFAWGLATDTPVAADYDGDGKTDAAVYRDGIWYVLKSTGGITIQSFGLASDKPVPSAYLP